MADLCFVPDAAGALWASDWLGQCRRYDEPPYNTLVGLPVVSVFAPVPDCAVSPDGQWLAAASWNRTATVFRQRESIPHSQVLKHTGEVTSVDWSPDGRRLLTASATGEVFIWDRVTGRKVFSWTQEAGVVQAAFALGGSRIVIARMDGKVLVREVSPGGGPVREDAAEMLEELSGYRLGDDGGLKSMPGSKE